MRPILGLASMVAALVLCLLLASATAARLDDQQLSMGEASGGQPRKNTLLTYYFDAFKPTIELSSRGSGRTDRTGLTVRMSEASVNTFMPVVSPRPSGMTHEVTKTWEALKVRVHDPCLSACACTSKANNSSQVATAVLDMSKLCWSCSQ